VKFGIIGYGLMRRLYWEPFARVFVVDSLLYARAIPV